MSAGRIARAALILAAVLSLVLAEVAFWVVHFACGVLTIGFGLLGALLDTGLRTYCPWAYA